VALPLIRSTARVVPVLGLVVLVACSEEPPSENCPARAAFHVVVRAAQGPVPSQTAISIDHGGGTEEFRLDEALKTELLFCEALYADTDAGLEAGATIDAGKSEVLSVSCDLWTQAATEVTVKAPGYPLLERQLAVETADGCIETQQVELLLDASDGAIED
jgi:hypothetical protein